MHKATLHKADKTKQGNLTAVEKDTILFNKHFYTANQEKQTINTAFKTSFIIKK